MIIHKIFSSLFQYLSNVVYKSPHLLHACNVQDIQHVRCTLRSSPGGGHHLAREVQSGG